MASPRSVGTEFAYGVRVCVSGVRATRRINEVFEISDRAYRKHGDDDGCVTGAGGRTDGTGAGRRTGKR